MARRRRKSNSRASRLSEALAAVNLGPAEAAIEAAREYANGLQKAVDDYDAEQAYTIPAAPAQYDPSDLATDATCAAETVGELHDEIETWKDNIEEHFSQTQKYSDLEECASALETIKDALESISVSFEQPAAFDGLPMGDEVAALAEKWTEFADSLEEVKDEVQSALDNEGDVNFPGMFG